MNEVHRDTESAILEAANTVFIRNGFEGTSMQQIADEAGINKALLHYYFRSKDKLFEAVFISAFSKISPMVMEVMQSGTDLFDKITRFIDYYMNLLQTYPQIPLFILHELKRNPDHLVEVVQSSGINPGVFISFVEEEVKKGTIRPVDPMHLMVNMLAMCIFTFAAQPMIFNVIFRADQEKFDHFMRTRKEEVTSFIINAIRK
jgi:TetR/AcrR family transcriptional regulator